MTTVHKDRRQFLQRVGGGALAAGLLGSSAGCAGVMPGSGSETAVGIGLPVPEWSPFGPVEFAARQGYYEDAGLGDVTTTTYSGGGKAQEALIAGEETLAYNNAPAAAQATKQGADLKLLAVHQIHPHGWSIDVAGESPYEDIQELDGKRIGVTAKGSTTDIHAVAVAEQAGIDWEILPVGASGLASGLKSGDLDAISHFPGYNHRAYEQGWARQLLDLGEYLGPTIPNAWMTRQSTLEERTDAIGAVLEANYRATKYLQRNESEAIEFLMDYTGNSRNVVERAYAAVIDRLPPEGNFTKDDVATALDTAEQTDAFENLPSAEELYTDRYLPVDVEP